MSNKGIDPKMAGKKIKQVVGNSKTTLVDALDANHNGKVDIEDLIFLGLKVPGVKIDRAVFLKKELYRYYADNVVEDAIRFNPAQAGIPLEKINQIADDVIQFERLQVSGISAVLSAPGGVAIAATLPTDIAQYYGYMLRAIQKLLYLYGYPDLELETDVLDSATMNLIILCMGVMYGVSGANKALMEVSKMLGKGVEKKIVQAALTKGQIYPVIKSIASWFNIRMTKELAGHAVKKAMPVVGAAIGGGLTYVSFKACCIKLKHSLKYTRLTYAKEPKDIYDLPIEE